MKFCQQLRRTALQHLQCQSRTPLPFSLWLQPWQGIICVYTYTPVLKQSSCCCAFKTVGLLLVIMYNLIQVVIKTICKLKTNFNFYAYLTEICYKFLHKLQEYLYIHIIQHYTYVPVQVRPLLSSSCSSLQVHTKLPLVLVQWCSHGEIVHSLKSKDIQYIFIILQLFKDCSLIFSIKMYSYRYR